MPIRESHTVPEGISGIRFSDYAFKIFKSTPTKSGLKKAIKRGAFLIDGKKAETGSWIQPGQIIELINEQLTPPKAYRLKLEIVYEDNCLAVVNKPPGIPVSGNTFRTIQNALIYNIQPSKDTDALPWPKPVHRLDSPTSGLLIVAKTQEALIKLSSMFETRKVHKTYYAIVIGKIISKGIIDNSIENQPAETEFERLSVTPSLKNEHLSLVRITPKTGRTHQIRIHLAHLGHPILGDKLYGNEGHILKGKGLFLCATELYFKHPIQGQQLQIKTDVPPKFGTLLNREQKRWKIYHS